MCPITRTLALLLTLCARNMPGGSTGVGPASTAEQKSPEASEPERADPQQPEMIVGDLAPSATVTAERHSEALAAEATRVQAPRIEEPIRTLDHGR